MVRSNTLPLPLALPQESCLSLATGCWRQRSRTLPWRVLEFIGMLYPAHTPDVLRHIRESGTSGDRNRQVCNQRPGVGKNNQDDCSADETMSIIPGPQWSTNLSFHPLVLL